MFFLIIPYIRSGFKAGTAIGDVVYFNYKNEFVCVVTDIRIIIKGLFNSNLILFIYTDFGLTNGFQCDILIKSSGNRR